MKTPAEKLLEINQDPTARMLYEAHEKQRRDVMSMKRQAGQEGEQKGIKKVAKNLLEMNMPIEDIELDIVEVARFFMLIQREHFDYAKWQENLFEDMTLEELCEKADNFWQKTHKGG